ncbi:putative phage abortive infection protein [Luteimonas sp. RD2P54]|uniref:Phage abortive infection protein n=1 Tax=Luteimonas endophytica TaxID=3042023 RepID=A0ABT6J5J0_9GAMM|nr:putative phage abortive infection protein [Luteimonas endophytica]MDH5822075.1 putative phage abortive infection protein [Luteimonas endophytica]
MTFDKVNADPQPSYRALIALLVAITALWVVSGLFLYPLKQRGTFGDMFGAVNALFSGLAFASLIYTIYLQRNELRLQRQELRLTRAELEGQKLQIAAQNDLLRAEGFESSFFRVLGILAEIVKSIDIQRSGKNDLMGRDCFSFFYRDFRVRYEQLQRQSDSDAVTRAYMGFYSKYQGDVGHYFRTLYNLVKFVDRSYVADKRFYTNLIRAQLSSQELLLLFYNCQTTLGQKKFKPLVERYALLKTVPFEQLLDDQHKAMYDPGAYGEG